MGDLLAFPGAEGFAKYATGGRGGKVLHVTNLNDSGAGSLREAFNTTGPRTIVFDVGGDIFLESNLTIWEERGGASGDLTIAGETAPFPGITLRNKGIQIHNSNVIIKYITIRLNEVRDTENTWDCIRIRNWGTGDNYIENFMFDHLSLSHGDDEIFNPNGHATDSNYGTRKITMQNCTVGKPNTEYNVLVGTYVYDISFINNYFHNSADRSVLFGYGWNKETSEFINNIVYGYNYGTTIAYGTITDVIGNLYKPYPWRGQKNAIGYGPNVYNNPNGIESNGSLFTSDNFVMENDAILYDGNAKSFSKNNRVLTNSLKNSWANTPSEIENLVMKSVGNSLYRDELDQEYINNYFDGTGDWNIDPIPNKTSTKRESNYDTDFDGMADEWELIRFGNLNHDSQEDENSDGYTNLEEFLYSLTNTD
ncbi:MAG TPA: hypothetical protein ENH58_02735 [Maribacter sp.]|nr:hypothetical protein [Maribacter sp.]